MSNLKDTHPLKKKIDDEENPTVKADDEVSLSPPQSITSIKTYRPGRKTTEDSPNKPRKNIHSIGIQEIQLPQNKPYDGEGKELCPGWCLEWKDPESEIVHAVVPGPFFRDKLLRVQPYVTPGNEAFLKVGIPDPWLEYVAWKKGIRRGFEDPRLNQEYVKCTEYIWTRRGLPIVQGIPDPWRQSVHLERTNHLEEEKKKSKPKIKIVSAENIIHEFSEPIKEHGSNKRSKSRDLHRTYSEKINCAEEKKKSRTKIKTVRSVEDVMHGTFEPKIEPETREVQLMYRKCHKNCPRRMETVKRFQGFEKVKRKLLKLDEELRLKEAKYKCHADNGIEKTIQKKTHIRCEQTPLIVLKESKTKEILKQSCDPKAIASKKNKYSSTRETDKNKLIHGVGKCHERINPKRGTITPTCPCGMICESQNSTVSTDDLKKVLCDIDSRIKITKNVLNSPEFVTNKVNTRPESTQKSKKVGSPKGILKTSKNYVKPSPVIPFCKKREKGAGEKEIKKDRELDWVFKRNDDSFKVQSSSDLSIENDTAGEFLRKSSTSNGASEIQDCNPSAAQKSYLPRYSYLKSTRKNYNSIAIRNDQHLNIESISEKDFE